MGIARPTAREIYLSDRWLPSLGEAQQEECEKRFFLRVRLQNKVFKTTYSRRLDDVNRALNGLLPRGEPVQLMDVAISSGISTQEWVDSLVRAGVDFRMVAGDLSINAYLLSFSKNLEILVDRDGYPLHFDVFGQGVELSLIKIIPRPLSFLMKKSIARLLMKDAPLARYMRGDSKECASRFGLGCVPITLVSPRLSKHARLEIIEDDIVSNRSPNLANRFHAIRAANILNRRYFGKGEIRSILINLRRRLRPGGLLAVCRTLRNNQTDGTIFSLNDSGRFQAVKRIGDGSEIEEDALSLGHAETAGQSMAAASR
jgi:hypothetical protein